MRERDIECKGAIPTFLCISDILPVQASSWPTVRGRKLAAEGAKSVPRSWQSRLEAVCYVIESFCNVYTEENTAQVGVAQSEKTACGKF